MDWADDVAYSVHDLEDGLYVGHITLPGLHDRSQQEAVADMTATYYCPPGSADVAELGEVLDDLLALPCWPERFDGGPASLAALKHLTSELIGRFCRAAQEATLAASAGTGRAGQLTRYDADLVVPRRQRLECALLKGVAAHYVMSRDGAAQVQARERELIAELAEAIRAGAPETLDPALRPAYDAGRIRPAAPARRGRPGGVAHRYFRYCLAPPPVPGTGRSELREDHPMPTDPTYLIVGASLAGAKAAETLRCGGLRRPRHPARQRDRAPV